MGTQCHRRIFFTCTGQTLLLSCLRQHPVLGLTTHHVSCCRPDEHMVAYGIIQGTRDAQASGWGHLFQDGGSSYDLACRALLAVSKAVDGRGAATALVDAILEHLQLQQPQDIIR